MFHRVINTFLAVLLITGCSVTADAQPQDVSRFSKGASFDDSVIRGDVKFADLRDVYLSLPFSEGTRFQMAQYLVENRITPNDKNDSLFVPGDGADGNIRIQRLKNNTFIVENEEEGKIFIYTLKYVSGKWKVLKVTPKLK